MLPGVISKQYLRDHEQNHHLGTLHCRTSFQKPKVTVKEPKVTLKEPNVAVEEPKVTLKEPKVLDFYQSTIHSVFDQKPHEIALIDRRTQKLRRRNFSYAGVTFHDFRDPDLYV